MVMHLPIPEACSVALIKQLVQERAKGRHAQFFAGLEVEWRERVEVYVIERGNPETVPKWAAIAKQGKRFHNLYKNPRDNSVQKPILQTLRERKLQLCPSCGEEGTPNTLDHYLPKATYPHFSVTPANLTPMCDICQGEKGEEMLDDEGRRMFLHPYFDEFLNVQVLHLIIAPPYSAPENFMLGPDLELPEDLVPLVQRHIEGLNLEARYGPFFREQYMRLLHIAQVCRTKGTDIREQIPMFKALFEEKAANVWPHIFYSAVLDDEDLLDYLADGDLPKLR